MGIAGWVYRVGIPGGCREGYTGYPAMLLGEVPGTSGAGPGGPARAGVGGFLGPGERGGGDGSRTTPAGPGRPILALPVLDPQNAASGPIWRDLTSFLRNIVKTTKCH